MRQMNSGNQDGQSKPFRDVFIVSTAGDPYEKLAPFGVTYESTTKEVLAGGTAAQQQRALTPELKSAEQQLRRVEKRLLVDLLYYQPDPSVFENPAASERASPDAPGGSEQSAASDAVDVDVWKLLLEGWEPGSCELPPLAEPGSLIRED
jgi:hypothetical protein